MKRAVFFRLFIATSLFLSVVTDWTETAVAQMQTQEVQAEQVTVPRFTPIGRWQVEATSISQVRGLGDIKLPCMIAGNYDNGYVVRLSGGDRNILAMAIDFRQQVFHQGRKYQAYLSVNSTNRRAVKATAFSENVLIFNLRDLQGFYSLVQGASNMQLEVQGNRFDFVMTGIGQAVQELEACYNGKKPTSPVRQANAMPQSITPTPAWQDDAPRTPRKAPVKAIGPMRWEARAGDDMQQTLQSWSARAGVALDWQASQSTKIVDDLQVMGSFQDAVQALMAQNATALGLDAHMMGGNGNHAPVVSRAVSRAPQSIVPTSSHRGGSGKWNAPVGSNLQQVLKIWSKQAGVEVIWQSNDQFKVKRGVNAGGSYEAALQSLLNQYLGEDVRPAVQLNNDPATGRRVLIVDSTRV